MGISLSLTAYTVILVFISVLPALLAFGVAKKQGRPAITAAAVAFFLGLTWLGGWLYLAVLTLLSPKKETVQSQE